MTSSIERDLIEMTTVSIRFAGDSGRAVPGHGSHRRADGAHLLRIAEQNRLLHPPSYRRGRQ